MHNGHTTNLLPSDVGRIMMLAFVKGEKPENPQKTAKSALSG